MKQFLVICNHWFILLKGKFLKYLTCIFQWRIYIQLFLGRFSFFTFPQFCLWYLQSDFFMLTTKQVTPASLVIAQKEHWRQPLRGQILTQPQASASFYNKFWFSFFFPKATEILKRITYQKVRKVQRNVNAKWKRYGC